MERGGLELVKRHVCECNAHSLEEWLYVAVWIGRLDVVKWMQANWSELRRKKTNHPRLLMKTMSNSLELSFNAVKEQYASERMVIEAVLCHAVRETSISDLYLPLTSSTDDYIFSEHEPAMIHTNLVDLAAANGRLDTVKLLTEDYGARCTGGGGLFGAISCGNVSLVQYIYASHPALSSWPRQEDADDVLVHFLSSGSREMLKYSRNERSFRIDASTLNDAIFQGDMSRLRLIIEMELVDWKAVSIDAAAIKCDFVVLRMLFDSHPAVFCTTRAVDGAAERGNLRIVRYLSERNVQLPLYAKRVGSCCEERSFRCRTISLRLSSRGWITLCVAVGQCQGPYRGGAMLDNVPALVWRHFFMHRCGRAARASRGRVHSPDIPGNTRVELVSSQFITPTSETKKQKTTR